MAVPLNDAGNTSLNFSTIVANENVRFLYNAECGVLGSAGSWMSVEIVVDGTLANPASGTQFAFRSSFSTTSFQWAGTARQATYRVPTAGQHTLQVLAAGQNGATEWWLGDTSIVADH